MSKLKIAFVIQRYGSDINGGSELLCRMVAERLTPYYDVEVLTSCSLKYHLRFENDYPPGQEFLNEVRIRRFPVSSLRPLDEKFSELDLSVRNRTATSEEERLWLEWVGPYSSELLAFLSAQHSRYHCFVFFTYLYATTTLTLPLVAGKSLLVPTVHDEPPVYARFFDTFFQKPKHIVLNTDEEFEFLKKRTWGNLSSCSVLGSGLEVATISENQDLVERLPPQFFLYAGRIQSEKGIPDLLEAYLSLDLDFRLAWPLVLVGQAYQELPKDQTIIHLGYLSDGDKNLVMSKASIFVMPSPYESLCLALLEAWSHSVPALVNGECKVLLGHCERSQGGMAYVGKLDFAAKLRDLSAETSYTQRKKMGEAGRVYVRERYDWEAVIKGYRSLIESEPKHSSPRRLFSSLLDKFLRRQSSVHQSRY